jgi:hypothetical protein
LNLKPTRSITKSHRSITGKKPSKKTGNTHRFESSLERDYIALLEFDDQVDYYVEQAFSIHYLQVGKDRIYTPDFLVIYKSSANKKTLLAEIKYKADLLLHGEDYKPKFDAAIKFCEDNGYRFSVITEENIRTTFFRNVVFLSRYKLEQIDDGLAMLILTTLLQMKESTPEELVMCCGNASTRKERLLYVIWQLVAKNQISCDLSSPIAMNSKIWIA